MDIIVRTAGERTTDECIRLASMAGRVHVVNEVPFGEAIRKTYEIIQNLDQKWVPVIDADVLLYPNVLEQALADLNKKTEKIFCYDGYTNDKILMIKRRAGVHIYRKELVGQAMQYIDNDQLKPESHVRRQMTANNFPTYTGKMTFGLHDHEQFYKDLWRKAVCQTQKLSSMVANHPPLWAKLAKTDKDYLVILKANEYGKKLTEQVKIDIRIDYGAEENLKLLGIEEKEPYVVKKGKRDVTI